MFIHNTIKSLSNDLWPISCNIYFFYRRHHKFELKTFFVFLCLAIRPLRYMNQHAHIYSHLPDIASNRKHSLMTFSRHSGAPLKHTLYLSWVCFCAPLLDLYRLSSAQGVVASVAADGRSCIHTTSHFNGCNLYTKCIFCMPNTTLTDTLRTTISNWSTHTEWS